MYNTVGRLPYYAACLFACAAGAFDPLGLKLFFLATVAAAVGGSSGLMWADSLMPRTMPPKVLWVARSRRWMVSGLIFGLAYVVVLGRGVPLGHRGGR